jgi:hypothetical protein
VREQLAGKRTGRIGLGHGQVGGLRRGGELRPREQQPGQCPEHPGPLARIIDQRQRIADPRDRVGRAHGRVGQRQLDRQAAARSPRRRLGQRALQEPAGGEMLAPPGNPRRGGGEDFHRARIVVGAAGQQVGCHLLHRGVVTIEQPGRAPMGAGAGQRRKVGVDRRADQRVREGKRFAGCQDVRRGERVRRSLRRLAVEVG